MSEEVTGMPQIRAEISRRRLLRYGAFAGMGVVISGPAAAASVGTSATAEADSLLARAKSEGKVNTMGLTQDTGGWDDQYKLFTRIYGVKMGSTAPEATSAEQIRAVETLRGVSRAPDVMELDRPNMLIALEKGFAVPYKTDNWDTVNPELKDPDGRWVASESGVVVFGVNTNVVKDPPVSWKDLLLPKYKNQVAIHSDPRASGSAFAAVYAAAVGISGSTDSIQPGIDFFAELAERGNFNPTSVDPVTLVQGQTPIAIRWDYSILFYKEAGRKAGVPIATVVPPGPLYKDCFCQVLNAYGPHPAAAKIFRQFLLSDAGQIGMMEAYAHPARYDNMLKRNLIPASVSKELIPAAIYHRGLFPSIGQIQAAAGLVEEQWGPKVVSR